MEDPHAKRRRGSGLDAPPDPSTALFVVQPSPGAAGGELSIPHLSAIRRPPQGALPHMASEVSFASSFFEDYELSERELGRGTFSVVRLCRHRASGALRAVKVIDTRRFRLGGAFRPAQVLDEVRILRGLPPHPGIIRVHEVYQQAWEGGAEALLLVTDYAPLGELFDSIVRAGNFGEAQATWVLFQLLQALAHLHGLGVVHRDVKPENVLVFGTDWVPASKEEP